MDYDLVHFDQSVMIDATRTIPMIRAAQARRSTYVADSGSFMFHPQDLSVVETSSGLTSSRKFSHPLYDVCMTHVGNDLKLVASPWSPPAWMKTNRNMLKGGKVNDTAKDAWARYIVRWTQAYASYGVGMWAMTVQNEPESSQQWESCEFKAPEQARFVTDYLGPTIRAAYPNMKIFGFDHNKDHLREWASTLFNTSSLSADYVDGMAFHWYAGTCQSYVRDVASRYPGKILLPTEACYELAEQRPSEVDSQNFLVDGIWSRGEGYGYDILVDLEAGSVGWTDWNLLLDEAGGPNHVHNFCDAPLLVDTRVPGGKLHYHPQYYFMGHFSKFLLPGSKRVHVDVSRLAIDELDALHQDSNITPSTTDNNLPVSMVGAASTEAASQSTTTEFAKVGTDVIVSDCPGWPVYGRCPSDGPQATAFLRPDAKVAIIVMNCAEHSESVVVDVDKVGFFKNLNSPAHSIQTYIVQVQNIDNSAIGSSRLLFLERIFAVNSVAGHGLSQKLAALVSVVAAWVILASCALRHATTGRR